MSSMPRSSSIWGDVSTHPWEYTLRYPAQPIAVPATAHSLNLILVVSAKHGTDVHRRRRLEVGVAVFKGQFVVRTGPSLFVKGAFAGKDEMIVVEVELRGIVKEYLAHLAVERVGVDVNFKIQSLDPHRFLDARPEIHEALFGGKAIRQEQDLSTRDNEPRRRKDAWLPSIC